MGLIDIMEEKFTVSPNAKDLVAIVAGMKFARELRTSALVDENHNEISTILANYNQTIIQNFGNQQQLSNAQKEIVIDITEELMNVSCND